MVSVEDLRRRYGVLDVTGLGKCVPVPLVDFDVGWDEELLAQGIECHAERGCVYVVLPEEVVSEGGVKKVEKVEKESESKKTLRDEMLAKKWQPEEDELLIKLYNQGLNYEEIAKRIREQFPTRTLGRVTNHIFTLQQQDKIKPRQPEKAPKSKPGPKKGSHHKDKELPAGPEPPTPAPKPKVSLESPKNLPGVPAESSQPTINTTLTIQLTVDCNNTGAVNNFLQIIERMGFRQKEASV